MTTARPTAPQVLETYALLQIAAEAFFGRNAKDRPNSGSGLAERPLTALNWRSRHSADFPFLAGVRRTVSLQAWIIKMMDVTRLGKRAGARPYE